MFDGKLTYAAELLPRLNVNMSVTYGSRSLKGVPILAFLVLLGTVAAEEYNLGPDSQRKPNVPRGTVTHYAWKSTIFPGTERDYWVYVPS